MLHIYIITNCWRNWLVALYIEEINKGSHVHLDRDVGKVVDKALQLLPTLLPEAVPAGVGAGGGIVLRTQCCIHDLSDIYVFFCPQLLHEGPNGTVSGQGQGQSIIKALCPALLVNSSSCNTVSNLFHREWAKVGALLTPVLKLRPPT